METAVCKTSNGEVKDVGLCLNHETEGVLSASDILQNKDNILEADREVKSNSIANGHVGGNSETPASFESPKISEALTQKSVSPTLIEHAFNVMKNLFSPDKNRSKSANVLSPLNHLNSSGSPRNSIYIPNKTEICPLEQQPEIEISNVIQSAGSTEKNLEDHVIMNQLCTANNSNTSDFHNNTDDSFLTTVSRIDESFQSAVTHLDENGRASGNPPDVFNNSQNLDMLDSDNETLEGSGYCLENTMLKNTSCASEENKVENTSGESKPESLDATQVIVEKSVQKSSEVEVCQVLSVNGETKVSETGEQVPSIVFKQPESLETVIESSSNTTVSSTGGEEVKCHENMNGDVEALENKISTTTVVLDTVDSADLESMLLSLKADGSGTVTPSSTSLEGEVRSVSSECLIESQPEIVPETPIDNPDNKSEISGSKSVEVVNYSPVKSSPNKAPSKSEGNSPNKSADSAENKQNKSADLICKSPQGEKSLQESQSVVQEEKRGSDVSSEPGLVPDVKTILSPGVGSKKEESTEVDKNEIKSDEPDSISVVSQQSYTVLNTIDKNLNRPVIQSSEDLQKTFSETASDGSKKSDATFSKDSEVIKNGERANTSSDMDSVNTPKHSTPVVEGSSVSKLSSQTRGSTQTFVKPTSLGLQFEVDPAAVESEGSGTSLSEPKCDFLGKAMQIFASNEEQADFSPINSLHSIEKHLGRLSIETIPEVSNTWLSEAKSPNQTFEKKPKSPSLNTQGCVNSDKDMKMLNQTYEKDLQNDDLKTRQPKLNNTFDVGSSPARNTNRTFVKGFESPVPDKLNQTYDKKPEVPAPMNQTFDKNSEGMNKTFDLKANETFEKEPEVLIVSQQPIPEQSPPEPSQTVVEELAAPSTDNLDVCREVLNNSFISTTSSNASLLCTGNSTVFLASAPPQENQAVDDLALKLEGININEDTKIGGDEWGEPFIDLPSKPEDIATMTEDKLSLALKDEKLLADAELAQLIQEQFSSTDIEKICSVVDDIPSMKLSSQILKASEQFEKSFHGSFSNETPKPPEVEFKVEKTLNDLTPHSLDYLNSIKGKPTGRDLSRDSLYVKFDPLVQPPNANSLIDFTKEVEVLATIEASPESETHNEDVCEQLLSISPEKKPDDIVPPLTPLSHKTKSNDDKAERLKELQNEIYFLKNLYNERERVNKAKFDDYETQIAKLTGQNCVYEEKLKESNEREKSLVKKLKEQTENIAQLKVVMEEYVKTLKKLTLERMAMKMVNSYREEALKTESAEQIEALNNEKQSYITHLQNTEAAFMDVYAKYEKSKKIVMNMKANEIAYKNTIAEQTRELEELKEKAAEAQAKALREYQSVQEELNESKAIHSQETTRLKAQLRKTELKLKALQESFEQKVKENAQLTAICDELIEGKK